MVRKFAKQVIFIHHHFVQDKITEINVDISCYNRL